MNVVAAPGRAVAAAAGSVLQAGRPLAEPVPGDEGREAARHELERIGAPEQGTSFPRWWNELLAAIGDATPGGIMGLVALLLLVVILVTVAVIVVRQLLRRQPSGSRDNDEKHIRKKPPASEPEFQAPDEPAGDESTVVVPLLSVDELHARADTYAAAGRYREAVRERLRATVRDLVDHAVVDHRPGWTVTELVGAAGGRLPAAAPALTEAGRLFSDIWYGDRAADLRHDHRMRALADDVHAACEAAPAVAPATVTAVPTAAVSGWGGAA